MCIVSGAWTDSQWDDEETKENENMEAPPNFNLLPSTKRLLTEVLVNMMRTGKCEIAILAPTNANVRRVNDTVAKCHPGEIKEYLYVDSLKGVADPNMFEPKFLNSLHFSGIPPHRIVLKIRTPIIMIRKLNNDAGLCNGTRRRVVSLRERSIEATIMLGPFKGKRVFIPLSCDSGYCDDDEQAQGQSINHVRVNIKPPVFAHGQLVVEGDFTVGHQGSRGDRKPSAKMGTHQ
ncbi:LOW QUALITY PROTEIN: Helitron helicase-like protein [Phytophthora palmivora]|uniref:Helitron helicase-like protein n=1 Tax=Phytophthora palmivora TaxID=4796 RepID=A0A2P4Y296_9STRA|nr:LOW QUALITY PROTEIN: Helitron helicase-like protein [Phytophthora palmivora]